MRWMISDIRGVKVSKSLRGFLTFPMDPLKVAMFLDWTIFWSKRAQKMNFQIKIF